MEGRPSSPNRMEEGASSPNRINGRASSPNRKVSARGSSPGPKASRGSSPGRKVSSRTKSPQRKASTVSNVSNISEEDEEQRVERLKAVFTKIDKDADGKVVLPKLETAVRKDSVQALMRRQSLSPEEKRSFFTNVVNEEQDEIDFNKFQRLVSYIPSDQREIHKPERMLLSMAHSIVPPASKPESRLNYCSAYSCIPPPLFILLISIAQVLTFIGYSVSQDIRPRWLTGCPGCYDNATNPTATGVLTFDPYKRQQAWRFFTYMFIHSGIEHLTMNVLIQVFLGLPLELVHKAWRIGPLYLLGVILSAGMQGAFDPNVVLVGASGGGYCLLSAHLGNVILNWSEMPYSLMRLILVLLLAGFDIGQAFHRRYSLRRCSQISYLGHFGGALTGLFAGVLILRNIKALKWEKYFRIVAGIILAGIIIALIVLNITSTAGSTPIWSTRCIKSKGS